MDVGDADPGNLRGRHACVDHLTLGALSRIEENALAIPAEQVSVVIARSRRDLGGGSEENEFTHATESPTACRVRPWLRCPCPKATAGGGCSATQENAMTQLGMFEKYLIEEFFERLLLWRTNHLAGSDGHIVSGEG